MPRVSTYGGRQVTQQVRPGAFARNAPDENVFGAQFGDQVARLGGVIGQIAQRTKKRADELAVITAENDLAEWESARLYDPERGALTVKGQAAFELPESVSAEFDARADELEAGLTNDSQRERFGLARQNRRIGLGLTLRRHTLREIEAYDLEETQKSIANSINAAVENALDPARINDELIRAEATATSYAQDNGLGPAALEARLGQIRSDVHVGVIGRLLDLGRDQQAGIYFDEVQGDIDGTKIGAVEGALKEGTLRGEAQAASDRILTLAESDGEAREMVREISNPELRDAVDRRVDARIQQRRDSEKQSHDADLTAALNRIDQSGSVDAVGAALWSRLSAAERTSFTNYAKLRAGGALETDWTVYYDLFSQASDDPSKDGAFAQTNLMLFRDKLDDVEFKQLVGLQASIKTATVKQTDSLLDDGRTQLQVENQALDLAGIDRSGTANDETKAAVAQLRRQVAAEVVRRQQATGKQLENPEIESIVDDLLFREVDIPGVWSFLGGGNFRTTRQRAIDVTIDDVPEVDQEKVRQKLIGKGIPPTPVNIAWFYSQALLAQQRGE